MNRQIPIRLVVVALLFGANSARAAVIDFEFPTFAIGTEYGSPVGHVPGDVAFSTGDVLVTVEEFEVGSFTGFGFGVITGHPGPPTSFFPIGDNSTQALTINNINFRFDFTGLPNDVRRVTFDYVDLGGEENFEINTTGLQELNELPGIMAPAGFTINVNQNLTSGGFLGTVEIIAEPGNRIESLLIGGQEFGIDHLNAEMIPEPSSLALVAIGTIGLLCAKRARPVVKSGKREA